MAGNRIIVSPAYNPDGTLYTVPQYGAARSSKAWKPPTAPKPYVLTLTPDPLATSMVPVRESR